MAAENGLHGGAIADDIFASNGDLQAFFHRAELEVVAGGGGQELECLLNEEAFPEVETMEPEQAVMRPRTKAAKQLPRRCQAQHCGATKTRQWRLGPEGRGTLCNPCGVRYRIGMLLPKYRPLNSPTFSPEVQSNIHLPVVEMRLCPGSSATDVNAVVPFTLPTCQFHRSEVLKKQRSHIHPDSGGYWYGRGSKVWFLQGLEVAAEGGGEGAAAQELDWLSNKEAMESIEQKPFVVASRTMPVCRRRRALASSPSTTEAAAAGEHKWLSRNDTFPAMEPEPSLVAPRTGAHALSLSTPAEPGQRRRCRHCETTETPQWREGPEGRRTLCTACGAAYKKGYLAPEYRPLSSPTFSPELHSNRHRRVVKMRSAGDHHPSPRHTTE